MSCDDVANVRFNVCKTMEKLVRYLLKNYFLHVSIYLRFFQSFQGLWNKDGKLILSKVKPVLKKLRTDKDSDVQYFAQVRIIFCAMERAHSTHAAMGEGGLAFAH